MKLFNIFLCLITLFFNVYNGKGKSGIFDLLKQRELQGQKYTKILEKEELKDLTNLRRSVFKYPFNYEENKELYNRYPSIFHKYFLKYTHIDNLDENIIKKTIYQSIFLKEQKQLKKIHMILKFLKIRIKIKQLRFQQ